MVERWSRWLGRQDEAARAKRDALADGVVVSPALAAVAGCAWVGVVSVLEQIATRTSSHAPSVRLLGFAYTLLELAALGAAAALVVRARAALPRRPPAWLVVLVASLALLPVILPDDLVGLRRLVRQPLLQDSVVAVTVGVAVGVVTVFFLAASWLSRRAVGRPLLLGVAAAGAAVHALFFARDYPGLHLGGELFAAMLAAVGLAGMSPPRSLRPALGVRSAWAANAGLAVLALSLLLPIPNAVRADMFGSAASPVAPFALRLQRMPASHARAAPGAEPWFEPRSAARPTPPRTPSLLPNDAIVVLVTIDALRADVVMGGRFDARIPNLARLRDEGVSFTRARTAAPQTVVALTSLFTSKYYTELYFTGDVRLHAYPASDPSPRFPDLLRRDGVATVAYSLTVELEPRTGVLKGFRDIVQLRPRARPKEVLASECAPAIVERVERAAKADEPLFVYAHWIDPHYPYDIGGTDCAPFECYLREVALVDEAVGRIRRAIDAPELRGRAALVVSADHGEAFGDHDTIFHGLTLYDELLRVPLIAYGAPFKPRVVDEPVSLVDVGPTVLDLFGLPAPRGFMGQSLAPILAGGAAPLARPIAADSGRLMQAYVFRDGVKIIRDTRHAFVEMYDLTKDPAELDNLFDAAPDGPSRLGVLDAFFAANAHRYEGGGPPFRM
ncbi:MAG TPA: sulfatase-like hydrolase/transferase [Byssovorax sp.]